MAEESEGNSDVEGDKSNDDEEDDDISAGVEETKRYSGKNRIKAGLWSFSQLTSIEDLIKNYIYVVAPIVDTTSFSADDGMWKLYHKALNMSEGQEFTQQQKKSLISMTKYRLDQTRSRDRKIAFRNLGTYGLFWCSFDRRLMAD